MISVITTPLGMPKMLPLVSQANAGEATPVSCVLLVSTCRAPAPMLSVASVTMKALISITAMTKPLMIPKIIPVPTPASTASGRGPSFIRTSIVVAALSPVAAPTDRSNPPTMSTKVMPAARIMMNIDWVSRLAMFS